MKLGKETLLHISVACLYVIATDPWRMGQHDSTAYGSVAMRDDRSQYQSLT